MGRCLYVGVECTLYFAYILNLVISIKFRRKLNLNKLRYFFVYPLVGVIVSIFSCLSLFKLIRPSVSWPILDCSVLFHYFFLSMLIYRFLDYNQEFKWIVIFFSAPLILVIAFDIISYSTFSSGLANFLLLTYCIVYFRKLMKSKISVSLKGNSPFLVCCGVFLGTGLIVPFSLLNKYLSTIHAKGDIFFLIAGIAISGHVVMNFFFTKAILCPVQKVK